MIRLGNDYSNGAHPEVLRRIIEVNYAGEPGYSEDTISGSARRLILRKCGLNDGVIFFISGGTQTNRVALDWILRPGEGVICAEDAHINVHEAAAIEGDGHKVIAADSSEGKIPAHRIEDYMRQFIADPTWPHRVIPGAVYITQPTERGTLYSINELKSLRGVCDKYGLKLYLDGARLAYALGSTANDVSLTAVAQLADAFYIGGTKCGALFGEALVFPGIMNKGERIRLFNHIKRHGALAAKGWILAAQFQALLEGNLYENIGREADAKALRLKNGLRNEGILPAWDSCTNQQFFTVANSKLDSLPEGSISYDLWGAPGKDESIIRLVTDWSTPEDVIDSAIDLFR